MTVHSKDTKEKLICHFNGDVSEPFEVNKTTDGQNIYEITSRSNVVMPGDVIAQFIHEDVQDDGLFRWDLSGDKRLEITDNVDYDESRKSFIAKIYGFARILDRKTMDIVPLFYTSDDHLRGYITVYPNVKGQFPNIGQIRQLINSLKIMYSLDDGQILSYLNQIKEENRIGGSILVAEGTPPTNGQREKNELIKDTALKIGMLKEDGRIDYKEKESFIRVEKGEPIIRKIPEIPPKPGIDIYGKETPGKLVGENEIQIGKNIVKDELDENLYVAGISGVLMNIENRFHVDDSLEIDGDVNLNTGNIHFNGSIRIKGSVLKGFTVSSKGNIIIGGNVEDAKVEAEGDIKVKNGIIGQDTHINCTGNLNVRFIQNATIWCEGSVTVLENVVQSKIFAKDKIAIGGSVIGGELIGKYGISVDAAGSPSEIKTNLTAAKDPKVEEEINVINTQMGVISKQVKTLIEETTQYFGEGIFNNPKEIIATLPKHRKIQCLTLLKQIKEKSAELNEIKGKRDELRKQVTFETLPTITVKSEVYPEVLIRIRDAVKKIEIKQLNTVFKEDKDYKVIYFE